jgi:CHAT domain-containing protein
MKLKIIAVFNVFVIGMIMNHGNSNLLIRPTLSQMNKTDSISSFTEIDSLISKGDIKKAIQALDSIREKARIRKDILEEVKAMQRLQVVHYFHGGGRRVSVYTERTINLLDDLRKANVLVSKELEDHELDSIILFQKNAVETGASSGRISMISHYISVLLTAEKNTKETRRLVKIYSGLAYLYHKNHKSKKDRQQEKAEFYWNKLASLDLTKILMEPAERINFLLTYVELIRIFHSNKTLYNKGIQQLNTLKNKYRSNLPILLPYFDLNIAYLHYMVGEIQESLHSLKENQLKAETLPTYIKFLTMELLADNHAAIDRHSPKANSLYSKILFEMEEIKKSYGGSDLVNLFLEKKIVKKQWRVRSIFVPENRPNVNMGMSIHDLIILEIVQTSSDMPYSYQISQDWWNDLTKENVEVENYLLEKGSIWDAFIVSEVTRGQFTRAFSISSNHSLMSEERSARYCYIRGFPCNERIKVAQGFGIAGENAIFPLTTQKLAEIVASQNPQKTSNRTHESGKSNTTIVQYFYDFKNPNPPEIHFYVFRPESNIQKVKPVVRCISLQVNSISTTCQKYKPPSTNSLHINTINQARKLIGEDKSFKNYINKRLNNIIKCKKNKSPTCNTQEVANSLKQFYQILVEPIADLLPTNPEDKIIFIPQGDLFNIPFAALKDVNDKYLIEKSTISIVPSILLMSYTDQLLAEMISKYQRNSQKKFLVFGNPKSTLGNLPFAEKEAEEIARMYGTNSILGQNATKERLIKDLYTANIIHLATHATIDDDDPLDSSIKLSPTITNPSGELTIRDIQNKMTAELVVLSSCKSGGGEINTDGINGFASRLMLWGNPTQVLSLWPAEDESTEQIMVKFHKNILSGKSKVQALRQAMLEVMQNSSYKEPYYWAAFTLIGNTN